jgi:hypothetical protein
LSNHGRNNAQLSKGTLRKHWQREKNEPANENGITLPGETAEEDVRNANSYIRRILHVTRGANTPQNWTFRCWKPKMQQAILGNGAHKSWEF